MAAIKGFQNKYERFTEARQPVITLDSTRFAQPHILTDSVNYISAYDSRNIIVLKDRREFEVSTDELKWPDFTTKEELADYMNSITWIVTLILETYKCFTAVRQPVITLDSTEFAQHHILTERVNYISVFDSRNIIVLTDQGEFEALIDELKWPNFATKEELVAYINSITWVVTQILDTHEYILRTHVIGPGGGAGGSKPPETESTNISWQESSRRAEVERKRNAKREAGERAALKKEAEARKKIILKDPDKKISPERLKYWNSVIKDQGIDKALELSLDGNLNEVRLLLEHGANVNAPILTREFHGPQTKRTLLGDVLMKDNVNLNLCKLLLEYQYHGDITATYDGTSLVYCIAFKACNSKSVAQYEVFAFLVARGGVDLKSRNRFYNDKATVSPTPETFMDLAARKSHIPMCRLLFTPYVVLTDENLIQVIDSDLDFKLMAFEKGGFVRTALEKGCNVNVKNAHGVTLLMVSFQCLETAFGKNYDLESTSFLLEKGADVNARDRTGYTPLYYALKHYPKQGEKEQAESIALINRLLDQGADVNAPEVFALAHQLGIQAIMSRLSKAGAIPSAKEVETVVKSGSIERMRNLLSLGAKPTSEHLAMACEAGDERMVGVLALEAKVPCFPVTLHTACRKNQIGIVHALLDGGAEANIFSLVIAFENHNSNADPNFAIIRKLIAKGARPSTRCLEVAYERKYGRLVLALIEAGCPLEPLAIDIVCHSDSTYYLFSLLIPTAVVTAHDICERIDSSRYLQLSRPIQEAITTKINNDPSFLPVAQGVVKKVMDNLSNDIFDRLHSSGKDKDFERALLQIVRSSLSFYILLSENDPTTRGRREQLINALTQKSNALLGKKTYFDPINTLFKIDEISSELTETLATWRAAIDEQEYQARQQKQVALERQQAALEQKRTQEALLVQEKKLEEQRERLAKEERDQREALAKQAAEQQQRLVWQLQQEAEIRQAEMRELVRKQEESDRQRRDELYRLQTQAYALSKQIDDAERVSIAGSAWRADS